MSSSKRYNIASFPLETPRLSEGGKATQNELSQAGLVQDVTSSQVGDVVGPELPIRKKSKFQSTLKGLGIAVPVEPKPNQGLNSEDDQDVPLRQLPSVMTKKAYATSVIAKMSKRPSLPSLTPEAPQVAPTHLESGIQELSSQQFLDLTPTGQMAIIFDQPLGLSKSYEDWRSKDKLGRAYEVLTKSGDLPEEPQVDRNLLLPISDFNGAILAEGLESLDYVQIQSFTKTNLSKWLRKTEDRFGLIHWQELARSADFKLLTTVRALDAYENEWQVGSYHLLYGSGDKQRQFLKGKTWMELVNNLAAFCGGGDQFEDFIAPDPEVELKTGSLDVQNGQYLLTIPQSEWPPQVKLCLSDYLHRIGRTELLDDVLDSDFLNAEMTWKIEAGKMVVDQVKIVTILPERNVITVDASWQLLWQNFAQKDLKTWALWLDYYKDKFIVEGMMEEGEKMGVSFGQTVSSLPPAQSAKSQILRMAVKEILRQKFPRKS